MQRLVDYESSESDEEHTATSSAKKFRTIETKCSSSAKRLPVPDAIKNLNNVDHIGNTVNDNPEEHDGKCRNFKHERGNWATYVHIPCELKDSFLKLSELIKSYFTNKLTCELKSVTDYHISLTRTVVLRHHWIDSLMALVKQQMKLCRRFHTNFNQLNVYCNDEKNRTFIGLSLSTNNVSNLKEMVNELDGCLSEFNLPRFYEDPSFHMSILWCSGDYKDEIEKCINELNLILEKCIAEDIDDFNLKVTMLCCKCGNKKYVFDLL